MRSVLPILAAVCVLWGATRLPADPGSAADADERAQALAASLNPGYAPWAAPFFTPDETTVGRGLWLQAAGGAVLFVAVAGALRRRATRRR